MKKIVSLFIVLLIVINLQSQNSYMKTTFLIDKEVATKELFSRFKRSSVYNHKVNYRIVFIYTLDINYFDQSDITDNAYLDNLNPVYYYRKGLFNKKKLCCEGYLFDEGNRLVATYDVINGLPLRFKAYKDNPPVGFINKVLSSDTKFDLLLSIRNSSENIIWCIKGNSTELFDIYNRRMISLREFYKCCWEKYRPNDIIKISIP
jgi:hypothetical protein